MTYHAFRTAADGACAPTDVASPTTLIEGLQTTLDALWTGRSAAESENADVIVLKADYETARVSVA